MKNFANKRSVVSSSLLTLVLCVVMLIGTTFAWFTDSASTGINKITAGNLDIALSYKTAAASDYTEVSADADDLFLDVNGQTILWEPGAVSVCYFKLENLGTLDASYKMAVSYEDTVIHTNASGEVKLSNALKTAIVPLSEGATLSRAQAVAEVEANGRTVALGYKDAEGVAIASKDTTYFAMVIYMPTDIDNNYNLPTGARALEIQLGIDLVATQLASEEDSFDNTYDKFADYPNFPDRIYVAETLPYTNEKIVIEDYEKGYWITIPAGAIVPNSANPNPASVTVAFNAEPGANQVTYSLSLKDEKNNDLGLNKAASITTYIGLGLSEVASDNVSVRYIESNGEVVLTATSVGSYVVTYKNPNVTVVSNAEEFISAMNALSEKPGHTISLADDIDMSGKTWEGVDNISFTLLGNGKIIKNLTNTTAHSGNKTAGGIVNYIGNGNSVIIKNLVLEKVTVGNDTDVVNAGAVIGYADAAREITLENVTVKDANVTSNDFVGGLIGWNAGYSNTGDGAVYALYTMKDCTVTDSTLVGGGSAGGAVGHAGGSNFTTNTIDNFKMTGTTVNGESGRTDKSGLVVGTANIGDVIIKNCETADFSGNTVLGTLNDTLIVGRLATSGGYGTLTINGTKHNTSINNFYLMQP